MKRAICLILTLLMLLSAVACGGSKNNSDTTTTTAAPGDTEATTAATEATTAETEAPMWSSLPDIKLDGYTFHILEAEAAEATGITVPQGFATEMTGELINDEVYKRNLAVADRFGVTITSTVDTAKNVRLTIESLIQSGDDAYQLVMNTPSQSQTMTLGNCLYNLYDIDHLDLTNPWYDQTQIKDFTIKDKLYYFMGDISYATMLFGAAFVYNTTLANKLQLPDVYEIVKSGKWTLDAMIEHTATAAQDLNGDAKYVEADDQFAVAFRVSSNLMNFQYCCGEKFIEYDATNDTFKNVFNLEKMQNIVDKVDVIMNQGNRSLFAEDYVALFNSGRTLMRTSYLGAMFEHRDMKDDFMPIPYPKYDEAQDKYYSMMTASCLVMSIPKSVKDTTSAGLIIEAMSECSAGDLKEAVYDRLLSYQTMRDEKSLEMLKIITDGLIIDYGYLTDTKKNIRFIVGDVVGDHKGNLSSVYAAQQPVVEAFYENLIKSYESLN